MATCINPRAGPGRSFLLGPRFLSCRSGIPTVFWIFGLPFTALILRMALPNLQNWATAFERLAAAGFRGYSVTPTLPSSSG
jgi:hypothetical protein